MDVNRDGNTDLVLIGAPHFYEQTQGGRVSVCPLPKVGRWQCVGVLRGEPGHPWGRFGAALTVLGDVNGDKLADVAIGAPGEEENRGAVYLFHGGSRLDIGSSHSQVTTASSGSTSLSWPGFLTHGLLSLALPVTIFFLLIVFYFFEFFQAQVSTNYDFSPSVPNSLPSVWATSWLRSDPRSHVWPGQPSLALWPQASAWHNFCGLGLCDSQTW
ncbi:integrin alpha-D-like isoform X2 [Tupaia chinensis]|uniref:integrin alpha-D-like isoform X2 n=1 Tax=Tupaia chinensis TaxID=246437 RepID=UPI000FFB675B|nr:integrin alpha-D-like isoform X2 [Tupaia chinensis]